MANHCTNLQSDRKKGAHWERMFSIMMGEELNVIFTPLQLGRDTSAQAYSYNGQWNHLTLPDITIWTAGTEHHEIKHKNPTKYGCFGLEDYRLKALLSFQEITGHDVFYTIHNHDLNGGTNNLENNRDHWFTANVKDLADNIKHSSNGSTWCNGKKTNTLIHYWSMELWEPLFDTMLKKYTNF